MPAYTGFVSVKKTYEVECSQCGIIDGPQRRDEADRIASEHARSHEPRLRVGAPWQKAKR